MPPESKHKDATQGQSDDPRQAIESGEPEVEGRTRGRVVDENTGETEGTSTSTQGKAGDSKDWESGRQQSM
jgi:hypothetical protein